MLESLKIHQIYWCLFVKTTKFLEFSKKITIKTMLFFGTLELREARHAGGHVVRNLRQIIDDRRRRREREQQIEERVSDISDS